MNTATQDQAAGRSIYGGRIGDDVGGTVLDRAAKVIGLWRERSTQRRRLAGLTPQELDDIGIDAEAAASEAAKPFWRP